MVFSTRVIKIKSKDERSVREAIESMAQSNPNFAKLFKTVTCDNGSEFASLSEALHNISDVYFTHPYSSWERGTNENHNGLLRRYIPKGKSLKLYSIDQIQRFTQKLNHLPRFSVDIDMDYSINNRKEEMLKHRELINNTINRYMLSQGYTKNSKTKSPHSLDSWVYDYIGSSGNRDNLKIEINYSLRAHILPAEERPIITKHFCEYKVRTLDPIEVFRD